MARRPTRQQADAFRRLIAELEPGLQRAFHEAIANIRASMNWPEFLAALARADIDTAVAALRIDADAFLMLWQRENEAFIAGATKTVETLRISGVPPGAGIRFDMRNPRAEAWMTVETGRRIQQVAEETQQAAREVIQRGYQAGRGPRDIATDVAGRVVGGSRRGGVIGLDAARALRLDAVTQGMKTADGVRDLIAERRDGSLGLRYTVNPATKARILRAYRAGTAVSVPDQKVSVDQLRNKLLKDRADTISQTETAQAVMAGRLEEWRQVLEKLGRSEADVIKTWQHGPGGTDPRPHHAAMNGNSIRGLSAPFEFNNGTRLQCAHDPNGLPSEVIRCTCNTTFRLLADPAVLR